MSRVCGGRGERGGLLTRSAAWAVRACMLPGLCSLSLTAQAVPSFDDVRAAWRPSDTVLLDRHGARLQAVRTDASALRGDWTALSEVSPALRHALLLSEDRRFYEHAGVDWRAAGAVAWSNLWNSRTRGASTVTMQLAGLLDERLAAPKDGKTGRSVAAKLGQTATALWLEQRWRKDQILEAYLNLVSFRGELVGIAALSAQLFHKRPIGLQAEESAIAAALVRSPNASAPRVAERACQVLTQQGLAASCQGLGALTEQVFASRSAERLEPDAQLAPHLAWRLVRAHQRGLSADADGMGVEGAKPRSVAAGSAVSSARIGAPTSLAATLPTTLDAGLQRFARDALREQLLGLQKRRVADGAVIVLDNASGEVLAWVGSSGELSQAADVDGVMALRQAGSTLKPFLYGQALEQRYLTAASLLDDSPVSLPAGGGFYVPENYDHGFKGRVSVRTALASSLNVPAVRTLVMVTPERFAQALVAFGLPLRHGGDYYGYSLALGSAEVTLATLSNAYRALANGGVASPWRVEPGASPPRTRAVLSAPVAYLVSDMLADREARALTFGLDNALATRQWAAVKTGTSKDMRDNWCVGFSRRFTVGVWVGNADGDAMWDVSGVTGAAPVWRAVMDELQRLHPDAGAARPPAAPAGLLRQAVRFVGALEPARDEWFLPGTEQTWVRLASAASRDNGLIRSPAAHAIVALDPDIPPAVQRLSFTPAASVPRRWRWRLDGRVLGPAVPTPWALWPGTHRLELIDERGQVKAEAPFDVRGAQTTRPARPTSQAPTISAPMTERRPA